MKTATTKRFNIDDGVWRVRAQQPIEYLVLEKKNFFDSDSYEPEIFGPKQKSGGDRRLVVIDQTVAMHFGDKITSYFVRNGIETTLYAISVDEESKNMDSVYAVLDKIIEFNLKRRSEPVIGIGGGVLLDIVGFATSMYRRGTPFVRVPTTLIGLIDAGIGIKTGINYSNHKNRIGTYYPPSAALLDVSFLTTLDERHIKNGMGEILKMALIKDAALFDILEKSAREVVGDKLQGHAHATSIIRRSIHSMLEELEKNLWEQDLERLVDFGHSFGPTIEMKALPSLLHGESVAVDMAISVVISWQRGLLSQEELTRIFMVYDALELPTYHDVCTLDTLTDALSDTVKHRDGHQRMPIPERIGHGIFVNDITTGEIQRAIRYLEERQA